MGGERFLIRNPQSAIRNGFTLIELIVVLVILGILAAIVFPRVVFRTEDARVAKARADVEVLKSALEVYRSDAGQYPTTEQGLEALVTEPTAEPQPRAWAGPYLQKSVTVDPWGHSYVYRCPGDHDPHHFDLSSLGADGQPGGSGNDADITSWE